MPRYFAKSKCSTLQLCCTVNSVKRDARRFNYSNCSRGMLFLCLGRLICHMCMFRVAYVVVVVVLVVVRDPAVGSDSFRRSLKTFLFATYWDMQRIRGSTRMHYINLLLLLLFTHAAGHWMRQPVRYSMLCKRLPSYLKGVSNGTNRISNNVIMTSVSGRK